LQLRGRKRSQVNAALLVSRAVRILGPYDIPPPLVQRFDKEMDRAIFIDHRRMTIESMYAVDNSLGLFWSSVLYKPGYGF
jgi:hypothetical protein